VDNYTLFWYVAPHALNNRIRCELQLSRLPHISFKC